MTIKITSTNNSLQVMSFNGCNFHFTLLNDIVYLDATQTAKPYGKRASEFIRMPSTKEYIAALERNMRKSHSFENQELIVTQAGNIEGAGTWLHYKLGLRFAGWLDMNLQIWMDEQIEKIMNGNHSPKKIDDTVIPRLQFPPEMVKEAKSLVDAFRAMGMSKRDAGKIAMDVINEKYGIDAPSIKREKVRAKPKTTDSASGFFLTPTEIGNRIGNISGQAVNKILHDLGMQFRNNEGNWEPTYLGSKYGKLFEESKAHAVGTIQQLKWLENAIPMIQKKMA